MILEKEIVLTREFGLFFGRFWVQILKQKIYPDFTGDFGQNRAQKSTL